MFDPCGKHPFFLGVGFLQEPTIAVYIKHNQQLTNLTNNTSTKAFPLSKKGYDLN